MAVAQFDAKEDQRLIDLVRLYGRRWWKIERQMEREGFPHRHRSTYSNRYGRLCAMSEGGNSSPRLPHSEADYPANHRAACETPGEESEPFPDDPTLDETDVRVSEDNTLIAEYLYDKPYNYNELSDEYLTFVQGAPKPIVMSGERHRTLVREYSGFDGAPATINEIAREWALPKPWVVGYLRCHGITHDHEPFTAEEVMARTDDDLVGDALQMRRAAVHRHISRAVWKDIERDARKYREQKTYLLDPLRDELREFARDYLPPKYTPKGSHARDSGRALVIAPTDLHLGKYAAPVDTRGRYDTETACARLREHTSTVLDRALMWGRPARVYVAAGSDFLHVDNLAGTTTKGTPQDVQGTLFELVQLAKTAMIEMVDQCRAVSDDVRVVCMGGSNHARVVDQLLVEILAAWFRRSTGVQVHIDDHHPRQYFEYGRTLLGFTHGDGHKAQQKELPRLMAQEQPEAWGRTTSRVFFSGHLHHNLWDSGGGVELVQLWSLANADRWHTEEGYVGSRKGLSAHIVDRREGLVGAVMAPVIGGDDGEE